jgi:hypothetical protein
MNIRQFATNDIWVFDNNNEIIKHLNHAEADLYQKTTQEWFADLLKKYKNDPMFIKESDIFEINEKAAKKALGMK